MTGDPLLSAFADHLGLSEDEARPALERVISALRATLDSGDSASLEGVGTFSAAETGPEFEPDPVLVSSLNGEYAGLGPVTEPVPVPFLTSFPVVPASLGDNESPVSADVDVQADDAEPAPSRIEPQAIAIDPGSGDDVPIELGPNDDVAGPTAEEEERDRDLAAVMAGVWAPPPSPPVAPLESPDEDFAEEVGELDDDQATLSFADAGFSFVDAAPAASESAPPTPFVPPLAAPFAATATSTVARERAPVVPADVGEEDDGGWSKLWLAVPLIALVAAGLWLTSRREPAEEGAGAPLASQPASGASGSGAPLGAGGAPADQSADSALAASTQDVDVDLTASEPVPEPRSASEGPATPPAADGAGAYRPAPIRLAPVPQRTPAPEQPAATRAVVDPTTRPTRAAPVEQPQLQRQQPEPPLVPEGTEPAGAWGMRGAVPVDVAAGGMTWVLASTDAADARERVAIYRSLGFRAAVLPAVVNGRQVYRVAVGQFANAAEARAARALLPNDAPTDAWLLRLGRTP